jgi:hypothetical protein
MVVKRLGEIILGTSCTHFGEKIEAVMVNICLGGEVVERRRQFDAGPNQGRRSKSNFTKMFGGGCSCSPVK